MSENNLFPRRSEIFKGSMDAIRDTIARPSLDTFYQVNFSFGHIDKWLEGSKVTSNLNRSQARDFRTKMSLLCTQAELPGTNYNTDTAIGHHQGIQESFPNLRNFPPLNLVFYCDADMVVLEVLETWMTYINPIQTNKRDLNAFTRFNYPEDYKEIIHVSKLEKDTFIKESRKSDYKTEIITYEFVNVWPTNLTSMRVAYGDSNVLRCAIQFAYDRFFTSFENLESSVPIEQPKSFVNSNDIQNIMTGGIDKNSLKNNINAGINAFPFR